MLCLVYSVQRTQQLVFMFLLSSGGPHHPEGWNFQHISHVLFHEYVLQILCYCVFLLLCHVFHFYHVEVLEKMAIEMLGWSH